MSRRPVLALDDVFVVYQSTLTHTSGGRPRSGGAIAASESAVVALRGLSLEVFGGERVVVSGPSGSGKSTLVHVATGAVVPSAGSLRLSLDSAGGLGYESGNVVSSDVGAMVRRGHVAVISQRSATELIEDLDVVSNAELTAQLRGASRSHARVLAMESLHRFGVAHLAQRRPTTLSMGEAQLVALAAALTGSPSLVVADEPTGDLDRAMARRVYALLSAYVEASGAALLMVSHDEEAQRVADRVATIRDGRLERLRMSTDGIGEAPLVVDRRGWIRLPEQHRARSGVGDRAAVASTAEGIGLTTFGATSSRYGDAQSAGETQADTTLPTPKSEPVVTAREVGVDIDAQVRALSPVSFELSSARLTVITGPSGVGKTTLLSILGKLREPTTGTLSWAGSVSRSFASTVLGFADEASVLDNVMLGCDDRSRAIELLGALGIDHLSDRQMVTLSGGERQRTAAARALAYDSTLVLLDEPTSQLDELNAQRTAALLIRERATGRTVVCSSHDPILIDAADHTIALA